MAKTIDEKLLQKAIKIARNCYQESTRNTANKKILKLKPGLLSHEKVKKAFLLSFKQLENDTTFWDYNRNKAYAYHHETVKNGSFPISLWLLTIGRFLIGGFVGLASGISPRVSKNKISKIKFL